MARALIGLGANLGDRERALSEAVRRLSAAPGGRLLGVSRWLATRPVGGPAGQGDFLNGALLLETNRDASDLHATLREIETALGRQRSERWEARPLDLDLLLFDDQALCTPELELPHPGLAFRRFVLEPAAEVASDMLHPRIGWTIGHLLEHLNRAPQYAAIVGVDSDVKRLFASRLASASDANLLACGAQIEGTPIDSPIHSLEQGIKLLDQWRRTLANVGSETSTVSDSQTWISDFWWGEFPTRIAELPADDRAAALAAWRSHSAGVARPKLLIVLAHAEEQSDPDAPSSGIGAQTNRPTPHESPVARATQLLISEVAQTPGHGPFLLCDTSRSPRGAGSWLDDAVRDAAAALEAMR